MLLGSQYVFSWNNSVKDQVSANNTGMSAIEMAITHNQKGITFLKTGYPLHAIDEFKIGIMLNPNSTMSATLYNNLGRTYEVIKEYNHALSCYEHAIRINPNFSPYYKNLVNVYIEKKQLDVAQRNYEKIVKINPEDAHAFFILALIYMEQANTQKAKESLNKFLSLEPHIDLASAARKYLKRLEK
jgi:tetratricopeptide (TPR) repeat protein